MHDTLTLPSRLRIALTTHSVNPRGGVVHTLELARALHDAGHLVTVFAPAEPGQTLFRAVPHAVQIVPVDEVPGDALADRVGARIDAYATHLRQALQRHDFDVLHAQDSISGCALAMLRERGDIAGFVRTVHHLDTFADARLAVWQHRAFAEASQVLCVSRLWCDTLRADHRIEAEQVANGVDTARFTPCPEPGDRAVVQRHGLRPGGPLLMAVGGIEARKNTPRLLRAFAQLRAIAPAAQLAIVGGATLLDHGDAVRTFVADAAALGLTIGAGGDIVLTGSVPDADMPALFREADAVLMPSLREGFGLVVIEALASGTPVVVSRIAPFTEYLDATDDAGWVWADPLSVTSIARAMQRAIDPARARVLAASTPDVCVRHSWPASAARHVALYRARHALARHAPAAFA